MEMNYDDIINLPHHVSHRHPRMSLLNRAAQFAPFAALTGYDDAIDETSRVTDGMVELDSDAKKDMDRTLSLLRSSLQESDVLPQVTVTFFVPDIYKDGGSYNTIKTTVKKIDDVKRCLILPDGNAIEISRIVDMVVESK
ncbi:MAG: hypothetical protein K6D59_02500 [Bacteroidales bacterium]|nr:hypothetical protein [Bacteroidales bacterium]